MINENSKIWEERYSKRLIVNKYPYDDVVSFMLSNYKSDKKNIKVLDLGCGTGNNLAFLAKEGYDYYGIDYSASAIQIVSETFEYFSLNVDESKLFSSSFDKLPFEDNFFDVIIDRQSIGQNNYDDIKKVVQEIQRTLKLNGQYFGINFSDRSTEMSYGTRIGQNQYKEFSKGRFKGIGERHFFSIDEVLSLFEDFKILNIETREKKAFYNPSIGAEELIMVAKKI